MSRRARSSVRAHGKARRSSTARERRGGTTGTAVARARISAFHATWLGLVGGVLTISRMRRNSIVAR